MLILTVILIGCMLMIPVIIILILSSNITRGESPSVQLPLCSSADLEFRGLI